MDPDLYSFTNQSGVIKIDGVSDDKEFEDLNKSLDILDFTKNEKELIFMIVTGVLHLGNVKFSEVAKDGQDNVANIINADVVALASTMLETDP